MIRFKSSFRASATMYPRKFSRRKLALAIAANMAMVLPALAENTDGKAVMELGPVIVTGEKIVRTEDKTLSSVEVVTDEEMREHGDQNVHDAMARTPGVYTQSGNANWGIRGVPVSGFDEQGAGTMNGAVSVFVDGATQPHRAATLNPLRLWDVEQVEIFRGAQSTTQGRNSLAGAMVVKTKDPTFKPEASVQVNAGEYGEQGTSALVNGALVEGKVAGRVAVDYQEQDGYIRNETLDEDANPLRSVNARGKLLVQPTEKLDLLLTVARTELRQGANAVNAEEGRPQYYSLFLNTPERDELDQNAATAKLDYYLSEDWTLTSITSATQAEYRSLLDFDQSPDRSREAHRVHQQDLASQELRLGYATDAFTGFLGLYYGTHSNDIDDRIVVEQAFLDAFDIPANPALISNGDIEIENKAIFGEVNWEFVDRWQLIGGLRYDREQNDTKFDYVDPAGFAVNPHVDESKSFNELLPKIGVSHELANDQLLGLIWQRGYRGGGVDLSTSSPHLPYDSETTDTFEVSWRGAFLDKKLRASANLYYTEWKDQQVAIADDDFNDIVVNAAESRMQGLEVSMDYRMTSSLQLLMGASYNDTEYLNFNYPYLVCLDDDCEVEEVRVQDLSGQQFPFAPKYKVTAGGLYTFGNGLQLGVDITHQDESVTLVLGDEGFVERINESVTLVNLNAEYLLAESLTLSGYVHNLTDKEYIVNNQGDDMLDVGAPRTAGVAARYDF